TSTPSFYFVLITHPPSSTLFPYTTLFRSSALPYARDGEARRATRPPARSQAARMPAPFSLRRAAPLHRDVRKERESLRRSSTDNRAATEPECRELCIA